MSDSSEKPRLGMFARGTGSTVVWLKQAAGSARRGCVLCGARGPISVWLKRAPALGVVPGAVLFC